MLIRHKKYKLDDEKIVIIENVLKLMIVAKGLKAGQTFFEVLQRGPGDRCRLFGDAIRLDKQATKDFLEWMITSDDGKNALASEMGFSTPFKTFSDMKTENPLIDAYCESLKAGKDTVPWTYTMIPSEQWKKNLANPVIQKSRGSRKCLAPDPQCRRSPSFRCCW